MSPPLSDVKSGTENLTQLYTSLEASPEGTIDGFYEGILGRAPDAAGVTSALTSYNNGKGLTLAQIQQQFFQSPEFQSDQGSTPSRGINLMYVNALGIAPSDQQGSGLNAGTAEIGFFLQQIDQGKSLAQVAGGFYLSNGSTQPVAEALIDIASSAQTGTDSNGKVIDQGSAGVFEAALATCQQGFLVEGADNRDRGENKWPSKPKPNLIPSLLRPRMRRARCLG